MKTCSCGRHYTEDEWKKLPSLGIKQIEEFLLEFRNCTQCGSTMTIEVDPEAPIDETTV
jgi:hypothetical protein